MDITDGIFTLLGRGNEWNVPIVVSMGDIKTAFDVINVEELSEGYIARRVPDALRIAVLREMCFLEADIHLNNVSTAQSIPIYIGGRQGGSNTPDTWEYRAMAYLLSSGGIMDSAPTGALSSTSTARHS